MNDVAQMGSAAVQPISPSTQPLHPKQQAAILFNKAVEVLAGGKGDHQLAYRLFLSAVDVDSSFPDGWYALGNANFDMQLREGAIAAHRRAIEENPSDGRFWCNLGHALYHTGRLEEARAATEQALGLNDKLAIAWCNLSLIDSIEEKHHAAISNAQRSVDLCPPSAPEYATCGTAVAFALLFAGRWAEGLKAFEARFPYKLPQYLSFPYPMWNGEDVRDKTLFIISEQGLGDSLCYLRFLPKVARRARKVILHLQPGLLSLAKIMLQEHSNIEINVLGTLPGADYWCAMTSMPVALGLDDHEIATTPNLFIPIKGTGDPSVWKAKGRRLHIGICWAGAPENEIDRHRSVKVEQFLELYRVPGIQLYSLQMGPRLQELHHAGAAALIRDLSPYIRDVADTIGFIRDLDLVISIETSVPHMAAAAGAECWVLYSRLGHDYRFGRTGKNVLWAPKHRVFKQEGDSWTPVMMRIVEALKERVGL